MIPQVVNFQQKTTIGELQRNSCSSTWKKLAVEAAISISTAHIITQEPNLYRNLKKVNVR